MPFKDSSLTADAIGEFKDRLRTLFVEGYILCEPEPLALAAPQGTAKTLTQIAMEQFEDAQEFQCGTEVITLSTRTCRTQIEAAMAQMKSVVTDVIKRLDVDFSAHDLYLSFQAMNLKCWQHALAAPQGSMHLRLRKCARVLCAALGVASIFLDTRLCFSLSN